MTAEAAGAFRRTEIERSDQRVAWERTDQAFFAAGACHVLAFACRSAHADRSIGIEAVRFQGEQRVFHTYATWKGWAFDHSGWNPRRELLAVNAAFEGQPLERVRVTVGLADFCEQHHHRMPHQYWRDPTQRACAYVARHRPPWAPCRRRPRSLNELPAAGATMLPDQSRVRQDQCETDSGNLGTTRGRRHAA